MAAPLSVEVEFGSSLLFLWSSFAEAVRNSCLMVLRNIKSLCLDRRNPGTSGTCSSGSRRIC
uniref:Ubiquitin related modifier 1 n=1 Tax=Aotus nancymaae TaxID=37293 RepID=A0A2K5EZB4_AOTNA